MAQNSKTSNTKQYQYWIDVRDLNKMISSCLTQIQSTPIGSSDTWDPDQSVSQSVVLQEEEEFKESAIDFQTQNEHINKIINSLADNDHLAKMVLKRFNSTIQSQRYTIEDVLQLKRGLKKIYLIENAKVITQVYQSKIRTDVENSLSTILDKLQQYQSKYQNKTLRLCFSSQKELFTIFTKIFTSEVFSNLSIRKIFQEIYEACLNFRDHSNIQPIPLMNSCFYLKIEFYCRGRAFFDTKKNEYPLHKAVFENNLPLISRLINCTYDGVFYQEKNELDRCGNTPLVLAVKLGHSDTIKVLCDLYTCPKLKSLSCSPCALDVASSIKSKEIIKTLLESNQKIKQHYLDLHKDAMFKALESLPDFKIDMHFQCQSNFIPFLQNITPSDTYRIYKQGSKLRLDMTLVGFRHLKCIRGNLSVLFKGRGQENEGELFVVDHDTKQVSNIFNNVVGAKLDKDLEDIMSDSQYQKLYKADKFQMEPQLDKRKGAIVSKQIEGYQAEKYNLKTQFTMTKYQVSMSEVQGIMRQRTYEAYVSQNEVEIAGPYNDNQLLQHDALGRQLSNVRLDTFSNDKEKLLGRSGNQIIPSLSSSKDNGSGTALNTVMGMSAKNKKTTKKSINASIWLCKSHPLSIESFMPLLQVLSFSSKQIAKFKDYLMKYSLPQGSFPLKAKIPIFFTMKAAFSLRNLQLESKYLQESLFTIDEEYLKLKLFKSINLAVQSKSEKIKVPEKTVEEIYKLFKTNEDFQDDEDNEDLESIQRANELFNSMLKKGNQSEDLLLESFHSEYDSVDLSERHLNDEQFKLASHAFTQIQTMDSINVRHDEPLPTLEKTQPSLVIRQIIRKANQRQPDVSLPNGGGAENMFDSKALEEKPPVNTTATMKPVGKVLKPPLQPQVMLQSSQDNVKTLKKNFQPRHFKNYKNMIKYNCNQSEFGDNQQDSESFAAESSSTVQRSDNQSASTFQKSTADNSVITTQLKTAKQGSSIKESLGMNWFKQILNYKNDLLGNREGAGYLHTIESEEVVATEGIEALSNNVANQGYINGAGGSSCLNRSSILSQGYYDDCSSRKSGAGSNYNAMGGGRDSHNVKSFSSGRNKSASLSDNEVLRSDRLSFTHEEKKELANHNALITRFHDYVATNKKLDDTGFNLPIQSMTNLIKRSNHLRTPTRSKENESALNSVPSPQIVENVEYQFENRISSNQPNRKLSIQKVSSIEVQSRQSLLPPKITHKRQSSYGGSSSNVSNYLGFVGTQQPNLSIQPTVPLPTGSGGIFAKVFGGSFGKASGAPLGRQPGSNKSSSQAQFTSAKSFMAAPINQQIQSSRQEAHKNFQYAQSIPQKMQTIDCVQGSNKVLAQTTSESSQNQLIGQPRGASLGLLGQLTRSQQTIGNHHQIGFSQSNSLQRLSQIPGKRSNDADISLSYQV